MPAPVLRGNNPEPSLTLAPRPLVLLLQSHHAHWTPEQLIRCFLGAHIPKGILLVGPPGTGKTLLARAVAGEAGVAFFSISGSEFVELFVGVGAARVRDLFEQARKAAPCIIFDELDALGRSRVPNAFSGHDENEQTLNQLLAELDGFDPRIGVILLAATNRPEIMDPTLRRAGRFDRQVLVDRPDKSGRLAILAVHIKRIKAGDDVELDKIAGLTPGFTGADIANLINEATIVATRRKADHVTFNDFTAALERIVAGIEKKSRTLSPDERRRTAYHGDGSRVGCIQPAWRGPCAKSVNHSSRCRGARLYDAAANPGSVLADGDRAQEPDCGPDGRTCFRTTDFRRRCLNRRRRRPAAGDRDSYRNDDQIRNGCDGQRTYAPKPQSFIPAMQDAVVSAAEAAGREIDLAVRQLVEAGDACAREILEKRRAELDAGIQLLLKQETLTAEQFAALRPSVAERGTQAAA
jgi:cell division protease FtsH